MLVYKYTIIAVMITWVVVPSGVFAAEPIVGLGGIYAKAEQNVELAGEYASDVVVIGDNVTITGTITGDLFVLARTFDMSGKVSGNVRGAVGQATIAGTVEKNVLLFAQTIVQNSSSSIAGHGAFYAETVELQGSINQSAVVTGNTVRVGGKLVGPSQFFITNRNLGELVFTGTAETQAVVSYAGADKLRVEPGARLATAPIFNGAIPDKRSHTEGWWLVGLVRFFANVVFALVLFTIFPLHALKVQSIMRTSPWLNSVLGLAWLVLVPIAIILLTISLIGIPVALLLMFFYGVSLCIAPPLFGYIVGSKLVSLYPKLIKIFSSPLAVAVLGLCVYKLIDFIPGVRTVVAFALMIVAMGALVKYLSEQLFKKVIT